MTTPQKINIAIMRSFDGTIVSVVSDKPDLIERCLIVDTGDDIGGLVEDDSKIIPFEDGNAAVEEITVTYDNGSIEAIIDEYSKLTKPTEEGSEKEYYPLP